jgi:hypothetical protein
MISKLFLGFTKHDRFWLTRITLCVIILSMLVLLYGYYGDISSYNEKTTKSMEERKVFKRYLDQEFVDYDTVLGDNNDAIEKYFDKKSWNNEVNAWPPSIIINEKSSIENVNEIEGKKKKYDKPNDVQQRLTAWFKLMANQEIDVNGKMC